MFIRVAIACISLCCGTAAADTVVIYCNDQEVIQEWEDLLEKNPGSPEIRYMYDLRFRLCERVETGALPAGAAIRQFEDERGRMIQRMYKRINRDRIVDVENVG